MAADTRFNLIANAQRARSVRALKKNLAVARKRVSDAESMGWQALGDSWRVDMAEIERLLAEHLLAIRLEAVAV